MRMLVFPYGRDSEPIIRHAELLESCYEVVALVSPGGWGMAGKNIMLGDNGVILTIYENIQEVTVEFDTLFIPAFEVFEKEVEDRLVNEIIELIPCLSHIIYAAHLTSENYNKLKDSCFQTDLFCDFIDFSKYKNIDEYGLAKVNEKYPALEPLDVPVVIVTGYWEKTDKFEVSLALRERFLKQGYRLSQIGSRDGCEMFGFYSFPRFMFSKDIDAIDKIIYFNRWIAQLVREEQPDLLLLTIPGAMQNFNEHFTRGFGILHQQVFQAVVPDIVVMCMPYMTIFKEALEEMSMLCKYKFGVLVDAFHMSNLFIDINESEVQNRIVTNSIYRETVSKTINKECDVSNIPIFNGMDSINCDKMSELILEKLTPKDAQIVF